MLKNTGLFYGYIIVLVSFFIMFIILGLQSTFGIFFKPIISDIGWTRAVTSGAFSLSLLVSGAISIAMGSLNDRFGPRIVLTLCGFLCGTGHILMSLVDTIWEIYLYYGILIGVGSGVFAPVLSTVARWFIGKRNMMTGIVFAGTGIGILILPPIINHLISIYEWRNSFIILGVAVFVIVIGAAQLMKRDPSEIGETPYHGNSQIEKDNQSTEGFTPREAMRHKQFWMLCLVMMFYGYCLFSFQVHIPPFITDLGIPSSIAALVLTIIGGATIVGETIMGMTADRIGNRLAFLIGFGLITAAAIILIEAKDTWTFFVVAVIFGFAMGDCSTQESPSVAWLFGIKHHGTLLGIVVFAFTIGAAIGPLISGYIFDVSGNYSFAFLLCAIIAILAFILMLFIKPLRLHKSNLK